MGAEAKGVMEGLTNETMGINGTTTENDFCTQDVGIPEAISSTPHDRF